MLGIESERGNSMTIREKCIIWSFIYQRIKKYGNPSRVLRKINEHDKAYYFEDEGLMIRY